MRMQRGLWLIVAGLIVAGAVGCQTIAIADRSLIPDGGQGGATGGGGQGGAGGQGGGGGQGGAASDAGDQ